MKEKRCSWCGRIGGKMRNTYDAAGGIHWFHVRKCWPAFMAMMQCPPFDAGEVKR